MIPEIEFQVDCGEVLEGHRLRATGQQVDGMSDDAVHADYSDHRPSKPVHPMVSLTYATVPALDPDAFRGRDVDAEVHIDPPADPACWAPVTSGGGERSPSGTTARIAAGRWPLARASSAGVHEEDFGVAFVQAVQHPAWAPLTATEQPLHGGVRQVRGRERLRRVSPLEVFQQPGTDVASTHRAGDVQEAEERYIEKPRCHD